MSEVTARTCLIREINPRSQSEIELVASRMRQTLIDVMGEERGSTYYSMEWLLDRVRWHLDPRCTTAKVYLAEGAGGKVTGQAIVRIERDDCGNPFGYFSTIYVVPDSRGQGIATRLLDRIEAWVRGQRLPKIVYNTAHDNTKLLALFQKRGFMTTRQDGEMVQLTKSLAR
jgi:ribosomal protein S18 acetylase RimI-like enzyme